VVDVCTPFVIVVVTRVAAVVPGDAGDPGAVVEPGGLGGAIIDRFTVARRTGVPESAATTRPRMIPVPGVSGTGRRPGSRTGACTAGGGGGGGGTCPAPAKLNANRRGVITTVWLLRQV
jgi:hypothetical protein